MALCLSHSDCSLVDSVDSTSRKLNAIHADMLYKRITIGWLVLYMMKKLSTITAVMNSYILPYLVCVGVQDY